MRPTYADLLLASDAPQRRPQRSTLPLLGFLTGISLALVLWTAIGWLVWALVA